VYTSRVSFKNDNLIMDLSNGGESSPDDNGGDSPPYFVSRRKLIINFVNIKFLYDMLTT
jgi:hypothetical protein